VTTDWEAVADAISKATGTPFNPGRPHGRAGGCINQAAVLGDETTRYFIKLNNADRIGMFEAEAAGLDALAAAGAIRVPRPVCAGVAGSSAFLAMQYLDFGSGASDAAAAGRQLAAMHRSVTDRFGWNRDNTIGSTEQQNGWDTDWCRFWAQKRLGFQLRLAARNGYGGALQKRGEQLLDVFPALIDHDPEPSLLHGDLWGGNLGYDRRGNPVIYDPAVYYGDREADLAMTELFGGFGRDFYAAYREAWPLDAGYRQRRDLYNLYHILNHLNLFGSGYLGQAQNLIDRCIGYVR
jgi:fructosamine-3-kinase